MISLLSPTARHRCWPSLLRWIAKYTPPAQRALAVAESVSLPGIASSATETVPE
jgi:hypothetical protein